MSSVPNPYILSPSTLGSKGGESHWDRSPGRTVSRWETIHTVPFPLPFLRARMLGRMTVGSQSSGTSTLSTESKPARYFITWSARSPSPLPPLKGPMAGMRIISTISSIMPCLDASMDEMMESNCMPTEPIGKLINPLRWAKGVGFDGMLTRGGRSS